jgi:uncharacterized membrane protein YfcA
VTLLEAIAIFVAAIGAGTINTIVGSGTLITFPTLLALGYPPVIANVSNTVGLVPGGLAGVFGYRRELAGQRTRLLRFGVASLLGGTTGALLLLKLPESAFRNIVPVLIAMGCVLVVAQPWISRHVRPRENAPAHGSAVVWLLIYACGIYGGYFGAAQGVLMIAIMGIGLSDSMQRINAAKNLLTCIVNAVAAVIFILVSDVDWAVVALIAGGSVVGGFVGSSVGRRLPSPVFRGIVALVGLVAFTTLVFFD